MKYFQHLYLAILLFLLIPFAQANQVNPAVQPQGDAKQLQTKVLEAGTKIIQTFAPLRNYNMYLVAFHPLKDNPKHQMTAYHYCKQMNEDFMQCVLFDSNSKQANLTGIEYIISEKLFNKLPAEEKKYWHPHNYEILSGQLIAPGVPAAAEKQLLKKKLNSYGKTWHTWLADKNAHPGTDFPLGEAKLAWSLNHDGEVAPELVQTRDRQLGVSTEAKRKERQDLLPYAKPQQGVDAIAAQFKD